MDGNDVPRFQLPAKGFLSFCKAHRATSKFRSHVTCLCADSPKPPPAVREIRTNEIRPAIIVGVVTDFLRPVWVSAPPLGESAGSLRGRNSLKRTLRLGYWCEFEDWKSTPVPPRPHSSATNPPPAKNKKTRPESGARFHVSATVRRRLCRWASCSIPRTGRRPG